MNRRSGSLFLVPLIGVALFALLSYHAQWRGEWNWTVDAITGSTVLTGPLTASAAAYLALTQRPLLPLLESTHRGWLVPLRVALRAWSLGAAAYVVTAVIGLTATLAGPHGGPFSAWVLLIGLAVLAPCACAGAATGWLWPHRLAPVLVAPAVFLLGSFGPPLFDDILWQGPETGSLAGLAYVPWVWAARLFAALALAVLAGAVALLPWRSPRDPRRTVPVAGSAAVALAALVATGVPLTLHGEDRFHPSSERADACRGTAPVTCLAGSDTRYLDATAAALHKAAAVLDSAGVSVPARYVQLLPGSRPPMSDGMLSEVDSTDSGLHRGSELVLAPAPCPQWLSPDRPPPDVVSEAQSLIGAWIVASGGETVQPWSRRSRDWLAHPAASDRRAWVSRSFGQLRSCRFDEIRLPWA